MPYLSTDVGRIESAVIENLAESLIAESVVMQSGATVIRTTGERLRVPRLAKATPEWRNELQAFDIDAAGATELLLTPRKVGVVVQASREALADAPDNLLTALRQSLARTVAAEADRALLSGDGIDPEPLGVIIDAATPTDPTLNVDFAGIATAAGRLRALSARPDVVFTNPLDHAAMQATTGGDGRPVLALGDTANGPAETVAGLRVIVSSGVPHGEALVCEAQQLVVALREDVELALSTDAAFLADGALLRCTCRVDIGVHDVEGLLVIGTPAGSGS